MTSLVRNSSIPRTGLPIPPRASCGSPATGLCSVVRAWLSAVIVVVRSVADAPVTGVEQGPLGADLGQPVEVVWRWRGAGRPFERVALPRVVAGRLAAAQRDEDVPQERD